MRSIPVFIITVIFCISALAQEKRLALVIGNSDYEFGGKLKNPVNDATLMKTTLEKLDFKVISEINADKNKIERAIYEFSKELANTDIALFYFAGHGIQVDGNNYLLPVDAELEDKLSAKFEAIDLSEVIEQFEEYPDNINLVILDACRNDPFKTWSRGSSRGFKAIPAPSGTLIAYATAPGSTAADGDGTNGLYTSILAKQMMVPQRVEDVFIQTRNLVRQQSNNEQNPQEWSQLTGKFFFAGGATVMPTSSNSTSRAYSGGGSSSTVSKYKGGQTLEENLMNGVTIEEVLKAGHTPLQIIQVGLPASDLYGTPYKGGLIFHVDEETGKCLIVAEEDLNRGNTYTWESAKKVCKFANINGHRDWKLPSRNQLFMIYSNIKKMGLGGFGSDSYWTSTESSVSNAWGISFGSGKKYDFNKTSKKKIRLVRSF
ncbi:caspase family protein [Reichenbachiella versicolor]|uniref:caspase family protein n=1 Tax=Reichenbachiella versicolor TaxID=1821036 RepID=UPI000D6E9307|nr:caspase family protein [Reichenbachiella versicolor]